MPPSPLLRDPPAGAQVADCSMRVGLKDRSYHHPSAHHVEQPSSPNKSKSEHSLEFKRWARGRCYRCLAHDHQVSSCKDFFRCIRCRRSGHRERHCPLRSPHPAPQVRSSVAQPHRPRQTRSWAEIVATSPHSGTYPQPSYSCTRATCGCQCSNLQSVLSPLMDSLRSELQQMFQTQLEEVVRPLKEEASTIKLWLARVANYLERTEMQMPSEEPSISDMAGLFGPCSPVRCSPTPSILASLAAACISSDPLVCEDVCEGIVDSVTDVVITSEEIHVMSTSDHTRTLAAHMHLDSPMEQVTLQATPVEDIVVVEDASDDEECSLDANSTSKDPIVVITVADGSTHVETIIHEPELLDDPLMDFTVMKVNDLTPDEDIVVVEDASDDEEYSLDANSTSKDPIVVIAIADGSTHVQTMIEEPKSLDDPLMDFTVMKVNDLTCPPVHPSPPMSLPTIETTRRRKSYDKSLLRRSARCDTPCHL
ncbi:unnamed protein product [Urochloa decumbens]|uniref:CCHC-type domain-containing protein n=1 Tax=Urochloa decumbens TaxID=240449 RepID=A0ABC9BBG3_9POAL